MSAMRMTVMVTGTATIFAHFWFGGVTTTGEFAAILFEQEIK
jgi:hypothetical protein